MYRCPPSMQRPEYGLLGPRGTLWSFVIGLLLLSACTEKAALADIGPTLMVAPGMGVLIYKTDKDKICSSCFQFSKPGPALRINLSLDLSSGTWGLRFGVNIFGNLAFQSWDDHGVDMGASRIAGMFSLGPTYKRADIQIALGINLGGGVEGDDVSVHNGLRTAKMSLYGGHLGIRFLALKPLTFDIEPASFVYLNYEEKDSLGNTTKLRIDVLWTPSVHVGYKW